MISLSLSPLPFSPRRLPGDAGAASGHHRPRDRWRSDRHRLPFLSRPFPAGGTACAGRKMRKIDRNSPKLQRRRSPSSGHHFRRPRYGS
ncbi:hypothetical protein L3X38_026051 [Prunus dulcis]|uniref:Uncharacterized protein n=1 Tax=Prunus dulcis TaxID=3755 RepID=A0AAD4Z6Z8_PRUDU|nr:hypothetical protein L3X38_026051 [Prunus dulcis]